MCNSFPFFHPITRFQLLLKYLPMFYLYFPCLLLIDCFWPTALPLTGLSQSTSSPSSSNFYSPLSRFRDTVRKYQEVPTSPSSKAYLFILFMPPNIRLLLGPSVPDESCSNEVCVGRSSGTAAMMPQTAASGCTCQCLQHLPVFRDDMQICVEDIHGESLPPARYSETSAYCSVSALAFTVLELMGLAISWNPIVYSPDSVW